MLVVRAIAVDVGIVGLRMDGDVFLAGALVALAVRMHLRVLRLVVEIRLALEKVPAFDDRPRLRLRTGARFGDLDRTVGLARHGRALVLDQRAQGFEQSVTDVGTPAVDLAGLEIGAEVDAELVLVLRDVEDGLVDVIGLSVIDAGIDRVLSLRACADGDAVFLAAEFRLAAVDIAGEHQLAAGADGHDSAARVDARPDRRARRIDDVQLDRARRMFDAGRDFDPLPPGKVRRDGDDFRDHFCLLGNRARARARFAPGLVVRPPSPRSAAA